jgi:hypothetical protein
MKLHIPQPCPAVWDEMLPMGDGRYCGSCQKIVVDFSAMDDREIRSWFMSLKGQAVCGRVAARNLERSSFKKRFYEWTRIAAAGSLLVSAAACDHLPFSGTETVGEIALPPDSIHQIDSGTIRPVPQPTHQLGAPLVSDSLPD